MPVCRESMVGRFALVWFQLGVNGKEGPDIEGYYLSFDVDFLQKAP